MRVREAAEADRPAIVAIINDVIADSVATFDLAPTSVDERLAWFNAFDKHDPLLVCESGAGVVMGYAYYLPFRHKAGYGRTKEVSVYVQQSARRQGVAHMLYRELIARARAGGVHALIAVLGGDNEPSRRLHESFGFRRAGHLREVGYKFGGWVDTHYYQLLI